MCSGSGGSQRAVIRMPDTDASDRRLDRQLALMNSAQQRRTTRRQGEYDAALLNQQATLERLNAATMQRAKSTEADARRITALIGAPAPEPTAKAPVLASNRTGKRRAPGRKQLRIEQGAAAAGTGLNIGAY
jgi:hypothetical protein